MYKRKSTAANAKALGAFMKSQAYGLVEVTGVVPDSFTKVEITVRQRAAGWDEESQAYEAVKQVFLKDDGTRSIHWKRNQRDEYGETDIVNVKHLKPL